MRTRKKRSGPSKAEIHSKLSSEILARSLISNHADETLFFAFVISPSSIFSLEKYIADLTLRISLQGKRYWYDNRPRRVCEYSDESDFDGEAQFNEEDGSVKSEPPETDEDIERFKPSLSEEDRLEIIQGNLELKRFGSLRVYCLSDGCRTPLITVKMQVCHFLGIAKRWKIKYKDINLVDPPYYCWVKVPNPKTRTSTRRKKKTTTTT